MNCTRLAIHERLREAEVAHGEESKPEAVADDDDGRVKAGMLVEVLVLGRGKRVHVRRRLDTQVAMAKLLEEVCDTELCETSDGPRACS